MAVGIVDRQKLVNIADAVREKKGITGNMTLDAIASNITSIPTADNNAKYDFTGSGSKSSGSLTAYLTTIDLSGLDTISYTSMKDMFNECKILKSIDVSGLDTRNVTNMDSMFKSCSSITSLDVSNFDTSNVITFNQMFMGCASLEYLDVSNFDISNTEGTSYWNGIRDFVASCAKLKILKMPSNVSFIRDNIYLNYLFEVNESLEKIIGIESWNTTNVVSMDCMFSSCSSLTSLDLSNWDTSKVTSMGNMFRDCSKLSNLTLGTDWASNSSISSFSLSSCPLTHDSAVDVINKLATRSNSPVIEFSNQVGLYQSEIDVANNKGWSVSGCTVLVDAETATVGQYALIDGEMSKCVYVADTPQSWGQRIFYLNNYIGGQWGGYETETGVTDTAIGTGLSNTNTLIAMNLKSDNGTPTVWDAVTEFRSTHSDRWFVPSRDEAEVTNSYFTTARWTSSESSISKAYYDRYNVIPSITPMEKNVWAYSYIFTYV